jgi:hypothetical protein
MHSLAVRAASLFALFMALASPGCRPAPIELDHQRIAVEIEHRATVAATKPEVEKGFDALVQGAFAEPSVGDAGKALLAALGAEPGLKPGFEAVLGKLGAHPAMKALVMKIVRENPHATADRVGEIAGERVGAVVDGPVFDQAFAHAFDELLARPDLAAAFHGLGKQMADDRQMEAALDAAVNGHGSDELWRPRLVALNGGKVPDKARATELFLDNAVTEQRFTRLYLDLTALPVMKRAVATAVRDITAAPTFEKHAAEAVQACADDDAFRGRAVDAMALMIGDGVTEPKLSAALRDLLAVPVVGRALATMVDRMQNDPALAAAGRRALDTVAADPSFRATLASLVEGW